MGGQAPIPDDKTLLNGVTHLYGDGMHFVSYPTTDKMIGWVYVLPYQPALSIHDSPGQIVFTEPNMVIIG